MRVLSLYDGISVGQQALEDLGIPVSEYYAFEIDPYAIAITQRNFPNTIQMGNVFDMDFSKLGHFDLVIGGSPCTYWSVAKKGREITCEGEGFKLFMRFVDAVRQTKATHFLYENNFSIHQDIKDAITEQLGVGHIMIDSALVSGQRRKRCYWHNFPNVKQPDDLGIYLKDILEPSPDSKYDVSPESTAKYLTNGRPKGFKEDSEKSKTVIASVYKGYGNDGTTIVESKNRPIRLGDIGTTAQGGGQGAKTGLYDVGQRVRRLTPLECERLQTLPDNYTQWGDFGGIDKPISDSQRYKCIGNSWTVAVIKHILKELNNGR